VLQQDSRHPRLGEHITRLVRSLAAIKGWSMARATREVSEYTHYSADMVYRWKQGRSSPDLETVKVLAQIGRKEAQLEREWGESLFRVARYPDAVDELNKLWGPKEIRTIPCNLPAPAYIELIGRENEVTHLLEFLSPQYAAYLITVDGIGGVGKTALTLEVAYRCLRASTGESPNPRVPTFDAIIFVSAKQNDLTPGGILPSYAAHRTLRDMFREIAHTLNYYDITYTTPQDQPFRVREALGRQKTLLIVDNVETMEDKQEIMSFLFGLPLAVKTVVTTRERAMFSPIRLEQLGKEEALNLIDKQAHAHGADISREQAIALYQRIGGIPAALVYAVGQITYGHSMEMVLNGITQASGDVARFCFEGSVRPLSRQPAYSLLMAMAMFPKYPLRAAVAHSAGLTGDPLSTDDGLAQLQRLSLISQQKGRYRMLPLTREYALAELAANPKFEQEARMRWVEWYLNFAKENGGRDWKEWHIPFDRIEEEWENFLAVFDWCATHELYDEMRTFWQGGGVSQLAHVYGYWDDKLTWLTWLIQAAERRGDWPTLVETAKDKAYTLTFIGNLEEADELFTRAWELHRHADPKVQVYLAQERSLHCIRQKKFSEALCWFDQAKTLLDAAHLSEVEHTRAEINGLRYRGLVYYGQQNYGEAERCFQDVVQQAQPIGWHRAIIYAQDYLANVAIIQGQFDKAEELLREGLTVSERNKDRRRTASYKRSFARLYQQLGNLERARYWARRALEDYERIGVGHSVEEVSTLLQQLQV